MSLASVAGGFPGGTRGMAAAGVGGTAAVAWFISHRGGKKKTATSTTSAGTDTASADTAGTPFSVAGTYPNTYATDVASAVGNLDQTYQERLDKFTGQLGTTDAAIQAMQSTQQKQLDSLSKATATATANSAAATKAAAAAKKQSDALAKAAAAKKKKSKTTTTNTKAPVVKKPAKRKPAIHHTPVRSS